MLMPRLSGESKVLIFLRVSSFHSHALCILSAHDSGRFLQDPTEVAQVVGGQSAQKIKTLFSSKTKVQRAPNTPEFAQPHLSRVKGWSSPARGYKFGCVCSYMAGVISHQRNDWPYRNKHTQIWTLSLGMTAL